MNVLNKILGRNKNIGSLGLLNPDPIDKRDISLSEIVPLQVDYPEVIDMDKFTIISNQFYGTCTSHGSTGADECQEGQEYGVKTKLSNKFVYLKTKEISQLYNDEGDYLRNALKALEHFGVSLDSDFPDEKMNNWAEYIRTPIPTELNGKALKHKIKGYARIGKTIDDFIKGMWTAKSPVPTGMAWYQSYNNVRSDGYLPPASGKQVGGHAFRGSIVDFKEEKVWFPNSWGPNWGRNGYFYIPFKEWSQHQIWDCWVIYPLPNDWRDKIKNMYTRYIDSKQIQYIVKDNNIREIPDVPTLQLLAELGWVSMEEPVIITDEDKAKYDNKGKLPSVLICDIVKNNETAIKDYLNL